MKRGDGDNGVGQPGRYGGKIGTKMRRRQGKDGGKRKGLGKKKERKGREKVGGEKFKDQICREKRGKR